MKQYVLDVDKCEMVETENGLWIMRHEIASEYENKDSIKKLLGELIIVATQLLRAI